MKPIKTLLPAVAMFVSFGAGAALAEGYYDLNPFSENQGVYVSGQAGGTFPDSDFNDSGSYALAVGYQVNPMIRAELEGAFRNTSLSGADSGDADTYTLMVNAFYDFTNGTRFTPYIGGGLGWAYQDVDGGTIDDEDNGFAYQLGAGASYGLTQNWALTADYRWVDTVKFDHGKDFSSHEIRAGMRYTF